jgi:hypothetical protein
VTLTANHIKEDIKQLVYAIQESYEHLKNLSGPHAN